MGGWLGKNGEEGAAVAGNPVPGSTTASGGRSGGNARRRRRKRRDAAAAQCRGLNGAGEGELTSETAAESPGRLGSDGE